MKAQMKEISQLNKEDRPREKAAEMGIDRLNDHELLALILGSGSKTKKLHQLVEEVLECIDSYPGQSDLSDQLRNLQSIKGIGISKAAQIVSAFELARRRIVSGRKKIRKSDDAAGLLALYADKKQEHFIVLSLNGSHEVIEARVISIGSLNRTVVHPREVFAEPLTDRAAAIIIAHNHPSGSLEPSPEDIDMTRRLKSAGEILGIPVLDHIIVSKQGFFSFADSFKM